MSHPRPSSQPPGLPFPKGEGAAATPANPRAQAGGGGQGWAGEGLGPGTCLQSPRPLPRRAGPGQRPTVCRVAGGPARSTQTLTAAPFTVTRGPSPFTVTRGPSPFTVTRGPRAHQPAEAGGRKGAHPRRGAWPERGAQDEDDALPRAAAGEDAAPGRAGRSHVREGPGRLNPLGKGGRRQWGAGRGGE